MLTRLREEHPELRVYAFDAQIGLAAVDTLKTLYRIDKGELPAIIVDETPYFGFRSLDDLALLLPELATTTATSTEEKSNGKK